MKLSHVANRWRNVGSSLGLVGWFMLIGAKLGGSLSPHLFAVLIGLLGGMILCGIVSYSYERGYRRGLADSTPRGLIGHSGPQDNVLSGWTRAEDA